MKAFNEDIKETLQRIGTNPQIGLTKEEVKINAVKYGVNEFKKENSKPFIMKIIHVAKEPMILILIIAVIITFGINLIRYFNNGQVDFIESLGIFVAISLAIIITVIMENRSEKAFEALDKIKENIKVKVIRNGDICLIPQKDLVVGDIIKFQTGDRIPVDGRIIESISLSVNESSLTGESLPVKKDANIVFKDDKTPVGKRRNMLYAGCFIISGSGTIVVTEVGEKTEFGNIARELSREDKGSTPLQEKLNRLGKIVTILGSTMAAIVFITQLIIFIANGVFSLEIISEAFITSIVLIVAAVPEGLPTIVAVSLAINIIKMAKENALVRKLIACETIGSINVICSDKTGTLTENRMTVTDIYANCDLCKPNQLNQEFLLENFCINTTADIDYSKNVPKFIGNPTECALIVAFTKSLSKENTYKSLRTNANIQVSYPFSSNTKNMTTVIKRNDGFIAYSKGSPEKILSQCRQIVINGNICKLTNEVINDIHDKIMLFQKQSCRVLSFAHKEFSNRLDYDNDRSIIESEMIYDGFVVITDPLREDVYEAVKHCTKAGIDLKILTGDNIITAKAIANQLGILNHDDLAMEAKEIEELSEKELIKILPRIKVIARSTPVMKMSVVNALKSLGNVVAVTGDGINDAPAIKNADVGIAMGITGTEVSKEASDIVLLDDSFSTIVKAVHLGRGIFENFQRFIQFQLTVNLSSVVVVLASLLAGFKSPFTALQLLWINIIMDGPPALTLGLEPFRDNLLERRPVSRDSNIVTKGMLSRIIFNGLFISSMFMLQTTKNILGGRVEQQSTILFTLFVVFHLLNAFNSREITDSSIFVNLTKNKLMIFVFAFTFLLQICITQHGGGLFKTVPLPFKIWVKIVCVAFTVIMASEIFKGLKRVLLKLKI
ncbi:calcium-translocating P-type ATPase, PMCA-type [Clostridium rectalis]|uniref:calcium-translocating P-type ATPase, PMCA-type n=1 Tax=Clostridium rectalis TaxID=2040295 RepID=UPI000F63DCEA|nr:calcium-translocating P-type ATPase, PMCA-type [Clostridium rectalis]